ncbi:hypothetical protein Enr10x_08360 [Gimesia panareensis]|uniref:Uncharacterized protein n=1 Tax=Gimesia panareensis TaxID=2527978 RepID=A0A517Q1M5_9PLAN|nr:hypothetical protein [Gimesia panareensis]QDT25539.1 hypothetical protein Enr10x_08360 [Gimesia panareensis]
MNLTQQMPTFARWYRSFLATPVMPYVAFLGASIVATALTPVLIMLEKTIVPELLVFILFVPLWLPVVAGDAAILLWSKKQKQFRPSILLRLLIMALVMQCFFLVESYLHPQEKPEYSKLVEVIFMSLYGAQCVLLLVLEPVLRWLLRRQVKAEDDRVVIH